ncbi:MAG: LacI family DNA-binding transcriptional regulator [Spirochaetota bacterium]|nr:LacI family DNA-binding transcriptional regulator [Spirochaetota bacterium]
MYSGEENKNPTIEDVARMSGVSRATVSRVINDAGTVRPATIDRIKKVMKDIGYTPHSGAKLLSGGRSNTVAVLLPEIWRPYYVQLLEGIENAASRKKYHILIKTKGNREDLIELIRSRRIDGLIIRNTMFSSEDGKFYQKLDGLPIKYVLIGNNSLPHGYASVTIDNVGGARAMAHHFAERGFSSILLIAGPEHHIDSNDRIYGFKLGLSERGFSDKVLTIRYGDFSKESGYEAVAAFFRNGRADAVFAVNDRMALGAMIRFKELGIRVPEDVRVAGFDDSFFAECIIPSLTTVRQPMYDMGFQAMNNLLLLLEGSPLKNQRVILPAPLIVRESC